MMLKKCRLQKVREWGKIYEKKANHKSILFHGYFDVCPSAVSVDFHEYSRGQDNGRGAGTNGFGGGSADGKDADCDRTENLQRFSL